MLYSSKSIKHLRVSIENEIAASTRRSDLIVLNETAASTRRSDLIVL